MSRPETIRSDTTTILMLSGLQHPRVLPSAPDSADETRSDHHTLAREESREPAARNESAPFTPDGSVSASDCYFGDPPTSREDSTVQVPAWPVVISDAASQKLGTNSFVTNWLRARARMVMSILPVGTSSRQASG
jgi:hypothetical protein